MGFMKLVIARQPAAGKVLRGNRYNVFRISPRWTNRAHIKLLHSHAIGPVEAYHIAAATNGTADGPCWIHEHIVRTAMVQDYTLGG